MIVSELFVYVGPPKTASTTLHRWLSQPWFCRERWVEGQANQHDCAVPAEARWHFTVASIRHPFDRVLSLWRHSLASGLREPVPVPEMSLPEFLEWRTGPEVVGFYRRSQSDHLGDLRIDALVRVERLEADLRRLPFVAAGLVYGLEPLPRLNELSSRFPAQTLDAHSRRVIREQEGHDFDRFRFWG